MRRGVLSIVNSIYDPLGLAVQVLLEGKLLLQQLVVLGKKSNNEKPLAWDDPLPSTLYPVNSVATLEKFASSPATTQLTSEKP